MPGCPECHIRKGLFSNLQKREDGTWICPHNLGHKYTRDKDGNFHSV